MNRNIDKIKNVSKNEENFTFLKELHRKELKGDVID